MLKHEYLKNGQRYSVYNIHCKFVAVYNKIHMLLYHRVNVE